MNPIPNNVENRKDNLLSIDTSIDWIISNSFIDYQQSMDFMYAKSLRLQTRKEEKETVWLLEHNHVYTKGASAKEKDLLITPKTIIQKSDTLTEYLFSNPPIGNYEYQEIKNLNDIPVICTNRGGKFTYHGPGQKICYFIMNLKKRDLTVHEFVHLVEELVIKVLDTMYIKAYIKKNYVGVWTSVCGQEKKIAAIGINVKKYITTHGFSINNYNNLNLFKGIVPCGISEYGITSLKELGIECPDNHLNLLINTCFYSIF